MIEPNCDMPWDIYLDWLQDQGNEDLRDIPIHFLVTVSFHVSSDRYFDIADGGVHWQYGSIGGYFCEDGDGGINYEGTELFIGSRGIGDGQEIYF